MTLMQELMQADESLRNRIKSITIWEIIHNCSNHLDLLYLQYSNSQDPLARFTEALNNLNNENPGTWWPHSFKDIFAIPVGIYYPCQIKSFFRLLILALYGISIANKRQLETIFIFTYQIFVIYYVSGNILSFVQMLNNLILTQS